MRLPRDIRLMLMVGWPAVMATGPYPRRPRRRPSELEVLRVTRHECRTSLLMNMDRSYEADRNPSAMVTVTVPCSP